MNAPDTPIVVFGEVLFDCFPDRNVLGGAPFNVAWNLRALGADPLFIGAVGDDERGREVRAAMRSIGLDERGLQTDPVHPTGQVQVHFEDGEPQYAILAQQAYDFIDGEAALTASETLAGGILYHGSLALRDAQSRSALEALRAIRPWRIFLDVNLRAPWWDGDGVRRLMDAATWVKLNRDELHVLAGGSGDDQTLARALVGRHALEAAIVTLGADGALHVAADGSVLRIAAPEPAHFRDPVGAGDAFSAVVLLGLARGWNPQLTLERAAAFAARICGLRGATTADPAFYVPVREAW
ncbi:MAG: carbohydrate kinase [Chromatiales bacterium]|jgi:fructokinase|nr:carbohydrate kinase [Chromatiales bacterium]MDX9768049.1 carbohydrate kinase [Ectothiorhodospiraceae bacterium]